MHEVLVIRYFAGALPVSRHGHKLCLSQWCWCKARLHFQGRILKALVAQPLNGLSLAIRLANAKRISRKPAVRVNFKRLHILRIFIFRLSIYYTCLCSRNLSVFLRWYNRFTAQSRRPPRGLKFSCRSVAKGGLPVQSHDGPRHLRRVTAGHAGAAGGRSLDRWETPLCR